MSLNRLQFDVHLETLSQDQEAAELLHAFFVSNEKAERVRTIDQTAEEFYPGDYLFKSKSIQFNNTITQYINKKGGYSYAVIGEKIGSGTYGEVYAVLAKIKHGKGNERGKMVYKPIDPENKEKHKVIKYQKVLDEKQLAKQKYENELMQAIPASKTRPILFFKNEKKVILKSAMLMKRYRGKTLLDVINQDDLSPKQQLLLSFNLIAALKKLHDEVGIIHADIKPGNIMVDLETMEVNIIDFGLSKKRGEHFTLRTGTPRYMAPEMVIEPEYADQRADVYSMGCAIRCIFKEESMMAPVTYNESNVESEVRKGVNRNLAVKDALKAAIYEARGEEFTGRRPLRIKLPPNNLSDDTLLYNLLNGMTAPLSSRASLEDSLKLCFELALQEADCSDAFILDTKRKYENGKISIEALPLYMNAICATSNENQLAAHRAIFCYAREELNRCSIKSELGMAGQVLFSKVKDIDVNDLSLDETIKLSCFLNGASNLIKKPDNSILKEHMDNTDQLLASHHPYSELLKPVALVLLGLALVTVSGLIAASTFGASTPLTAPAIAFGAGLIIANCAAAGMLIKQNLPSVIGFFGDRHRTNALVNSGKELEVVANKNIEMTRWKRF